jgi:hypothetical protein
LDHKLGESATYFPTNANYLIERCLKRAVRIVVKGSTNTIELVQGGLAPRATAAYFQVAPAFTANFAFNGEEPADEPPLKTMFTFRLKEVVMTSRLLRASSDLTRVRVTRPASARTEAAQWTIDLTKFATQREWPDSPGQPTPPDARGKLSWRYDLWLRDGDVIEIPEKQ